MSRVATSLLVVSFVLISCGCVRRRLTVRSNPPGASVYVDKQYIGTTPISTDFTYYGTREIELVADGYRTEKVWRTLTPPWYQIPPLDFISETLWPAEIRDNRVIDVQMVPAEVQSMEEIRAKGNDLRLQSSQAIVAAPPPTQAANGFSNGSAQDVPTYVPLPPAEYAPPVLPGYQAPSNNSSSFFQPNGLPPTRIPEAGILQGGGYRPPISDPQQ